METSGFSEAKRRNNDRKEEEVVEDAAGATAKRDE